MLSDSFRTLLQGQALRGIKAAWREGFSYVKAGVILDDLRRAEEVPATLFERPRQDSAVLMRTMDQLNSKYGRHILHPASMGTRQALRLRAEHHSPCYTTRLAELAVVYA